MPLGGTMVLDRGISVSKIIEKLLISSVSKILNFAAMLPVHTLSSTIFSSQTSDPLAVKLLAEIQYLITY